MGAILAKFRKEKSTAQVLEALEEKIQQIEKYSNSTQEQKKRFVGNFLAISIGIYVIAFLVFYFVYFPPTWKKRIIYSVPLLLFPFIIILLRRVFSWYFERKINKNSTKLSELRDKKKQILEQVMDKETYKVAVKLLARYGGDKQAGASKYAATPRPITTASQQLKATNNKQLAVPALSATNLSGGSFGYSFNTPSRPMQRPQGTALSHNASFTPAPTSNWSVTPRNAQSQAGVEQEVRRRTPFPIVNQQEKGVFDRIVDVLIGDGPQDRFAMICKECHAHNGMALKEDFEYTTFRCAFCNALNPSRKERPVAPRLPEPSRRVDTELDSSDTSSSDDESDKMVRLGQMSYMQRAASKTEIVQTGTNEATPTPVTTNKEEDEEASSSLSLNAEVPESETESRQPEDQADTLTEEQRQAKELRRRASSERDRDSDFDTLEKLKRAECEDEVEDDGGDVSELGHKFKHDT